VATWTAIAFGFGGLAVGALGLWLTYKERVAALRGALYARQVEAYSAVLEALSGVQEVALEVLTDKNELSDQERAALREKAQPQYRLLAHAFVANVPFLPHTVANAVADYREKFAVISAPPEQPSLYAEGRKLKRPVVVLTTAFVHVWAAMRHQLGTDPVSEQTLELFHGPERRTD
jgi:hypothetical protein